MMNLSEKHSNEPENCHSSEIVVNNNVSPMEQAFDPNKSTSAVLNAGGMSQIKSVHGSGIAAGIADATITSASAQTVTASNPGIGAVAGQLPVDSVQLLKANFAATSSNSLPLGQIDLQTLQRLVMESRPGAVNSDTLGLQTALGGVGGVTPSIVGTTNGLPLTNVMTNLLSESKIKAQLDQLCYAQDAPVSASQTEPKAELDASVENKNIDGSPQEMDNSKHSDQALSILRGQGVEEKDMIRKVTEEQLTLTDASRAPGVKIPTTPMPNGHLAKGNEATIADGSDCTSALDNQAPDSAIAGIIDNKSNAENVLNSGQPYMQAVQNIIQQPNTGNGLPSHLNTNTIQGLASNKIDIGNQNENYRDFSTVGNDGSDFSTTQQPGKEPPFPVKLHRILSNSEYSDVISWLPHGRSWRVLKPKAFEENVIPIYFRHAKYASFMRQVNGWGFKRMTQGPDHNSYYHELFLRGMPHLCYKMRRPTRARPDSNPEYNPDFYRLSALPTQDANLIGVNNVGNLNLLTGLQNSTPGLQNSQLSSLGNFGIGGIQNLTDLNTLSGINNFNLTGMSSLDNSLTTGLLQQQLQGVGQQLPVALTGGLQNTGSNLICLQNGRSELSQLEALRQRRKELVKQLQLMVQSGTEIQGNANNVLNSNTIGNNSTFPGGFVNGGSADIGSLLNSNIGTDATTAQLQQMLSLGINAPSGQSAIFQNGSFGGTSAQNGLNLTSSIDNGALSGINQHLLMQNNLGASSTTNTSLGLAGATVGNSSVGLGINDMSPNLGMLLQNSQLLGQQNSGSIPGPVPGINPNGAPA